MVQAKLFFKCENFQKVGAFKARGAMNAVLSLSDEESSRGVVTHSSGNHGAALAWASRHRGIRAIVVVPHNAPQPKKLAIESYGAEIVYCEPTVESRESTVREIVEQRGCVLIHPFDDDRVIAGQGTAALELFEDCPDLDVVLCPVGGGGFLSGTLIAAKSIKPSMLVYGTEPDGADDGYRSWISGQRVTHQVPNTVCDGLRTTMAPRTFGVMRKFADGMATASDASIVSAMRTTWESMKILVESSCMPPLGCLLEKKIDVVGKKVGILLSGGNVDLDRLPWNRS